MEKAIVWFCWPSVLTVYMVGHPYLPYHSVSFELDHVLYWNILEASELQTSISTPHMLLALVIDVVSHATVNINQWDLEALQAFHGQVHILFVTVALVTLLALLVSCQLKSTISHWSSTLIGPLLVVLI